MKILVATRLTQGTAPTDYHHCVEGDWCGYRTPATET